ncbi:hypothetical protein RhiirA1_461316 [Rhizophagus irregularis]|uniref:DUF7918 domain-containing protein n=3 Tax=Rhizophagus irregularis TaxID=588596 RepID=A0A2N0RPL2_9GLOM|nr:hypothetical protein GLOIN_2v1778092 [Rhizophagus irregularis DAOM 181602=DAOM 197198]EXX52044.1 hypothetical protein RirG_256620 [Rhizophagus irregularis DAOM 197198w]PKC65226.1 hypothetical protein RhiirA1_461316 [Rhizophagus irregularis]POG68586.1 hypothetical protein GLOIN_2v1778092 [Rhizophagus irregularis DAOM 181602=DAOM 197198]UZO01978.1 hypothetical protein OCT59_020484 [Rhizophagus irregularis]CAB4468991.1 unnamed protein product [Rhizophagus irregularis]|eukprot:XP_025175452.1 hypothetical protein GLOIN_2v1778092 [Rhizophagus irregularis DAOM 181602=DAOM 197198]
MRIERWTLEVLVNEIPLQEYVISDSVLGASASNALKSYVVEGDRKKFCDSATFVAVPAPGTHYSIVVSPSTSEIAPKIYVDGINDGYYVNSSTSSYGIVKGFYNGNKTMRYDFIFDKTEWIETDIPQRTKYGGLGAISVYFYKIINKYKSSRNYNSEKAFEKVKIPETKKCFDVGLTTKFSEGIEYYGYGSINSIIRENEPLAVLHINYRLADWLIPMATNTSYTASAVYRTNTQNSCASASTSTSSTSTPSTSTPSTSTTATSSAPASTSSSAATNIDIKNEVNNFENDTENKPLITQSVKKRKRRYQEMIIILDSDEECTHEVVELD